MTTMESVKKITSLKRLGVAGVSRNNKKFGNSIYREMKKRGYDVYPVNPHADQIEGDLCYKDIASLPEVDGLIINTPAEQSLKILTDAKEKGINNVWLQQGSHNKETIKFCEENNINYVSGECIFMFMEPVEGGHKFHRWIWKLIGKYPKN
jgi:predicted CoA-binding protein